MATFIFSRKQKAGLQYRQEANGSGTIPDLGNGILETNLQHLPVNIMSVGTATGFDCKRLQAALS
jgi:hypothetical protein